MDIKCTVCNKIFRITKARERTAKYCSRVCYGKAINKQIEKHCLVCGKSIKIRVGVNRRGKGKYCSLACAGIYKRKGIKKHCQVCGKEFYIIPSHYGKNGQGKCCSNSCRYKLPAPKGELNHNWRGGITTISNKIMSSKEYREWRESVFKRDNYKCRLCNGKSNKLHAHHIWEFAKFPEMRILIGNGITVCLKCHGKIHGKRYE